MPRPTLARGAVIAAVLLGLAGFAAYERYWYYLPGLIASIRDPVGPNRAVTWQPGPAERPAGPRPPNVVVILADDLGWNDITFNGGGVASGLVPTPRIDSIGHDGAAFTQAYAGDATCAPSRAAIMTGRYATRFGFEFTPAPKELSKLISTYRLAGSLPSYYDSAREKDVPDQLDDLTVPTSEIMIGQVMKSRFYHTVMLGKWHLGGTATTSPEARGFDEALAFYDGASMFLPAGDGDYKVFLSGEWKLQTAERPKKDWLFDLAVDPTEKNNLADKMPDKVAALRSQLAAIDAEQVRPLWPSLLEAPVRIDTPLGMPAANDAEYIDWAN